MHKTDPQICLNSSCEMDLPHASARIKCVLSVFSQNSFGSMHNIYKIGLYTVLASLSINTIWLCNFNANFCNSLVFRLFFGYGGYTNNRQMRTLIGLVFGFGSISSGLFGANNDLDFNVQNYL